MFSTRALDVTTEGTGLSLWSDVCGEVEVEGDAPLAEARWDVQVPSQFSRFALDSLIVPKNPSQITNQAPSSLHQPQSTSATTIGPSTSCLFSSPIKASTIVSANNIAVPGLPFISTPFSKSYFTALTRDSSQPSHLPQPSPRYNPTLHP
jgi:hypothetical protein